MLLINGLTAGIDFKFKISSIEWHIKVSIRSKHCIKVSLRCLVVHQTAFCYIPILSRMPFIVILPVSYDVFKKASQKILFWWRFRRKSRTLQKMRCKGFFFFCFCFFNFFNFFIFFQDWYRYAYLFQDWHRCACF